MTQKTTSYKIFNASAGSGKTFNLVKSYLALLLNSSNIFLFRNILALTFTNKAVEEMKNRVISSLQDFSNEEILNNPSELFKLLSEELNLQPKELHEKSKLLLKTILHNYAAFDISTIDRFNHRIIRTFSRDLNLPSNFEVELDIDAILKKTVDRLIDKAGTDKELTDLLVNFALEKVDDDRSWDISYDLFNIAQILVSENERNYVESIQGKSIKDFSRLKSVLNQNIKDLEAKVVLRAKETLGLIYDNGLDDSDFYSSFVPKHFKKVISLQIDTLYDNQLENNLTEGTRLYTKSLDSSKKNIIDRLCPKILNNFIEIKSWVFNLLFHRNALKNVIPLSVISELYSSLNELLLEEQLVLISNFNSLIRKEIKNQPAPYIYERLGDRYRHYFIDEFQDTSVLQWQNLIPLIDDSLSQIDYTGNLGSALIVGDAKQSIYRWRGGNAEQFIALYKNPMQPFTVQPSLEQLEENYRSHQTIVEFNNEFFKYIASKIVSTDDHIDLYESSRQNVMNSTIGYVNIKFLPKESEDKVEEYSKECFGIIHSAKTRGFSYKDICIITRTRKDNVSVAEYLSQNGLPIISSESLLLRNSLLVRFIISFLEFLLNPQNKHARVGILEFIFPNQSVFNDQHKFNSDHIDLGKDAFMESLNSLGFKIDNEALINLPLYELVESLIRIFSLNTESNAYVQFLLDELYSYSQKYDSNIGGFLTYWSDHEDKLSIQSPTDTDAIELMTIHKAKGLEFPIVIFPFANQDLYQSRNPKTWFKVNPEAYAGFSYLYVSLNKDLSLLNDQGYELYETFNSQSQMDNLNLLYVVLTRAVKELYVVSEKDLNKAGNHNTNKFSGLFIDYLKHQDLWNDEQVEFSFGQQLELNKEEEVTQIKSYLPLISTNRNHINLNILTSSGLMWDSNKSKAIERGNLIHEILSEIETQDDLESSISSFISKGQIGVEEQEQLKAIVSNIINHPKLAEYYSKNYSIFNERDILTPDGEIYRPDKIAFNKNKEVVVIDYKTGIPNTKHEAQIMNYSLLLENMGYKIKSSILIYIDEEIDIKIF